MEIPESIITAINAMLMPYGRSFGPPKEVPDAVRQAINAMLMPYGTSYDTKPEGNVEKKHYSLQEAADEMGLHYQTVYKMCREGRIKVWKSSNQKKAKFYIPAAELKAIMSAKL